jgi:hypothetical protein
MNLSLRKMRTCAIAVFGAIGAAALATAWITATFCVVAIESCALPPSTTDPSPGVASNPCLQDCQSDESACGTVCLQNGTPSGQSDLASGLAALTGSVVCKGLCQAKLTFCNSRCSPGGGSSQAAAPPSEGTAPASEAAAPPDDSGPPPD